MKQKLKIALSKGFTGISLILGQQITRIACMGPFYQGKVPEKMKEDIF